MIILAFDLGSHLGIAAGPSNGAPECSTEVLSGSHPARFWQALDVTRRCIEKYKPALIAIEEPIASGPAGKKQRVQMAMGLRANIFGVAYMRKVKTAEYPVGSIRSHFIGNGGLRRDPAKAAVLAQCHRLGWNAENHDEGDAAAVWDYARWKHTGVSTLPAGGLFGYGTYRGTR